MITWINPTDFEDPDSAWMGEANAYDDNTGTSSTSSVPANSWGHWLILKRAAVTCHRVRFYAYRLSYRIDQINLDVYYDGAWHDLYQGTFASETWVEKALASDKSLTKARVKFHNIDASDSRAAYLYEFDFGEVSDPDAPTDLEAEGQTNPERVITLTPRFTAIFNGNDTVKATHSQVQVGTARLGSDKWDSGKQALSPECGDGERCALIAYGGSTLAFKTKYWWRLKFWDTDDRASPWSDS